MICEFCYSSFFYFLFFLICLFCRLSLCQNCNSLCNFSIFKLFQGKIQITIQLAENLKECAGFVFAEPKRLFSFLLTNLKAVHRRSTVARSLDKAYPPNWKYQIIKNEPNWFIIAKCFPKQQNVNKYIIKSKWKNDTYQY